MTQYQMYAETPSDFVGTEFTPPTSLFGPASRSLRIISQDGFTGQWDADQAAFDSSPAWPFLVGNTVGTVKWLNADDLLGDLVAMQTSAGMAPIYVPPAGQAYGAVRFGIAPLTSGTNCGAVRSKPGHNVFGPLGYTIAFLAKIPTRAIGSGVLFANQRNYDAIATGNPGAGPADGFTIIYNNAGRVDFNHQGGSFRLRTDDGAVIFDEYHRYIASFDSVSGTAQFIRDDTLIKEQGGITQGLTTEPGGYGFQIAAAGIQVPQITGQLDLKTVITKNKGIHMASEADSLADIKAELLMRQLAA